MGFLKKQKMVLEYTEPCDVRYRYHHDEKYNQDLVCTLLADAEVGWVLLMGIT
jgi:hypothetical protein